MPSKFEIASQYAGDKEKNPFQLSVDEQLKLYALFKQASLGNEEDQDERKTPGVFDIAGKKKLAAWQEQKGKSKEDAAKEYVETYVKIREEKDADGEYTKKLKEELASASD